MDPCTVAALDAIAAFAVPNPSSSSQSQPVFSGLVARSGRPDELITQPTSDWQVFISPILSAVDGEQTKQLLE